MNWVTALAMCLLSFIGFSFVVVFARETFARRALVAMSVSAALATVSWLMVYTGRA